MTSFYSLTNIALSLPYDFDSLGNNILHLKMLNEIYTYLGRNNTIDNMILTDTFSIIHDCIFLPSSTESFWEIASVDFVSLSSSEGLKIVTKQYTYQLLIL